jgi:hypothetical protein
MNWKLFREDVDVAAIRWRLRYITTNQIVYYRLSIESKRSLTHLRAKRDIFSA